MENIPRGDIGDVGQAQNSQSAEHDSTGQDPENITASERLLKLLKAGRFSDELNNAAENVVRELDSVKNENKTQQQKIIRLNTSNNMLERRKESLECFSRRIHCWWTLKSIMQKFANYLQENLEPVIKRLSDIDQTLLDVTIMETKYRSDYTPVFVRQFLRLSLQERDDLSFTRIWMHMKLIPYQAQPDVEEIIQNNNLFSAFMELHQAANKNDAIQIFNRQKHDVWRSRNGILSDNDAEAVEALSWISADDALNAMRKVGFSLVKKDEEYARESFEIGPSVVNAENEQYRLCRWILMTSPFLAIIEICGKLEGRWPDLKRSQRLHKYSSLYAELFYIVSGQDLFGSSFKLPVYNDNPTPGEFCEYIQLLETSQSSDIAFVAETLCETLR